MTVVAGSELTCPGHSIVHPGSLGREGRVASAAAMEGSPRSFLTIRLSWGHRKMTSQSSSGCGGFDSDSTPCRQSQRIDDWDGS